MIIGKIPIIDLPFRPRVAGIKKSTLVVNVLLEGLCYASESEVFMNVFNIKFGLSSGSQAQIIDLLKNGGSEVIQLSSGLLTRSEKNLSELQKELSVVSDQISISELDPSDPDLSKDAKVFAGLETT